MSDATLSARSPLQGLALPAGPRFTLTEAPSAARFILRGGEGARVASGIAFGAEPPYSPVRGGRVLPVKRACPRAQGVTRTPST